MKKRITKILALGTMCMMFATTAFAAKKDFYFSLIPVGGEKHSEPNAKSDNEGYAYVTVESANLISGDLVEYSVTNKAKTAVVSQSLPIPGTIKPYKQTLKYKSGYAKKGKEYCLKVKSYNYSLQIRGKWNS